MANREQRSPDRKKKTCGEESNALTAGTIAALIAAGAI
jgi:hypothetical protein